MPHLVIIEPSQYNPNPTEASASTDLRSAAPAAIPRSAKRAGSSGSADVPLAAPHAPPAPLIIISAAASMSLMSNHSSSINPPALAARTLT